METRARYILVGFFAMAVIGGVFAFVYWLENATTLRDRVIYQIRFQNPVSGLLVGSSVSFNGIRVGEVTSLRLNPENPKEVTAIVAVDRGTPIRTDTGVEIDYQGVTGIASILLTGKSSTAPLLTSANGQPPVLVAGAGVGRSWTLMAGEVLAHVDGILAENSEPLHSTLTNLNKFSDALARNSDRVDGILAGLERMVGGKAAKAEAPIYTLSPPQDFPPLKKEPSWQLVIPEPTVLLALNTDKIMAQPGPGEAKPLADAHWSDSLSVLFQEKLIQSFENAGYLRAVTRPTDGLESDYRLIIDVRKFVLVTAPTPSANAQFVAKILTKDGKVIVAREFSATVAAKGTDAPDAADALSQAFAKSATELVLWTVGSLN